MIQRGMFVRVLVGMVLVSGAWGEVALGAGQERSFLADDKKEPDQKSGTVVGELTSKGENFIEVKADGEEKARRYVPNWVGGAPAQGGGPDKEMVKIIKDLKVGSRLRVEWKFEERPRVVKVEILKKPDGKPEEPKKEPAKDEPKSGKAIGALVTKGDRFIELKADGEEKPRRYLLHMGGTKELLAAIKDAQLNSRIEIEWIFLEHLRVVKLTVLKAPDK